MQLREYDVARGGGRGDQDSWKNHKVRHTETRQRAISKMTMSPLKLRISRNRSDPFTKFPVKETAFVRATVTFFLKVFAWQNRSVAVEGVENEIIEVIFPVVLHNEMAFHSMLACVGSFRLLYSKVGFSSTLNRTILRHHGQALKEIRLHLGSRQPQHDEALLISVSFLIVIDFASQQWESLKIHLNGLRMLVTMRDWEHTDSKVLRSIRESLRIYEGWANSIPALASVAMKVQPLALHYPQHPWTPGLCTTVAKLPSGFSEIVLTGKVSIEVIEYLHFSEKDLHKVSDSLSRERAIYANKSTEHGSRILTSPLNLLERGLVHAVRTANVLSNTATHVKVLAQDLLQESVDWYLALDLPRFSIAIEQSLILWNAFAITIAAEDMPSLPNPNYLSVLMKTISQWPQAKRWEYVEEKLGIFQLRHEELDKWKTLWSAAIRHTEMHVPQKKDTAISGS